MPCCGKDACKFPGAALSGRLPRAEAAKAAPPTTKTARLFKGILILLSSSSNFQNLQAHQGWEENCG
jgi:hypothetical protein